MIKQDQKTIEAKEVTFFKGYYENKAYNSTGWQLRLNRELRLLQSVDGVIPGGHICLILPAFSWLYGTLDKLDGHYRRYDKNEITRLIGKLDVEIKNYHYFNLLGALGWFVKGRILKEKHHTDANFNLINKILPVISTVERFLKPCFGLSIILVLKKRGRHKLTLAQQ